MGGKTSALQSTGEKWRDVESNEGSRERRTAKATAVDDPREQSLVD